MQNVTCCYFAEGHHTKTPTNCVHPHRVVSRIWSPFRSRYARYPRPSGFGRCVKQRSRSGKRCVAQSTTQPPTQQPIPTRIRGGVPCETTSRCCIQHGFCTRSGHNTAHPREDALTRGPQRSRCGYVAKPIAMRSSRPKVPPCGN